MKFQLKALAAALVLVAAVPAHAAIQDSQTGNSSFVLSVWDVANNISASFDLGKNYSDYNIASTNFANSGVTNPGTAFSWDLTSGDYAVAWSSFAAVANEANAQWAITAADVLGSVAGDIGYITTYTGAPFNPLNTNGLVTAAGTFKTYTDNLGTIQSNYQNHSLVANGSNTALPGTGSYAPTAYYDQERNLGTGPFSVGIVGQSLGVVQTLTGPTSRSQVTNTIFGNGAAFRLTSNGQLNYSVAAVPEADTWAMMLLGLGFMGFIARRKQA